MSKSIEFLQKVIEANKSASDSLERVQAVRKITLTAGGHAVIDGCQELSEYAAIQACRQIDSLLYSALYAAPELLSSKFPPLFWIVLSEEQRARLEE